MIKEFRLPDLGEGLTESELLSWHVAEGDTVALNQIIAEVETAKAVVELPSPFAGTVTKLHEKPGATVPVGAPIVSIEVTEDAVATPPTAGGAGAGAQAPAARQSVLVGYGPAAETGERPHRRARVFASGGPTSVLPEAADVEAVGHHPAAGHHPLERPLAAPPVRKLARDLGVDLAALTGSGDHGLITREDVQAAYRSAAGSAAQAEAKATAAAGAQAAEAAVRQAARAEARAEAQGGEGRAEAGLPGEGRREVRIPIKGVRKHTAAAMVASAFTAPHATEFLTVDVTPSMDLLDKLKASREFAGSKLTPLTLVAKALCIAVARNPSVNAHWDEAAQEIVQYNYVNLGIAAATPRGLMVPNIKDADRLSLRELSGALASLAETAREGKTSPADLSGGTISITNVGVFGIDAGTPILNPGEAAILAAGAVRRQPWEYQGGIALRQVMTLSLSFDHRLVDGEQGSRFLADIGAILADPGMVLTMV